MFCLDGLMDKIKKYSWVFSFTASIYWYFRFFLTGYVWWHFLAGSFFGIIVYVSKKGLMRS